MAKFQTYNFLALVMSFDLTGYCVKRRLPLAFSHISNVDLTYIYVKRQHESQEYESNQYF
jgi:hypothetical protein